jgi:hypothetical protein
MITAPGIVSNTQWIFIRKNPYAILGYSKLMDHNDLVSLNNSEAVLCKRVVLMRQIRPYLAKFFNSIFKYDTDGYPMEQLTETAKSGYLKSQYFTNKS